MRPALRKVALLAISAVSVSAPPPTGPFERVTAFLSEHDLVAAYRTHPENVARPQPLRLSQHEASAMSANYPGLPTFEGSHAFSRNVPSRFTPFRTINVLDQESPSSSATGGSADLGSASVEESDSPAQRVHSDSLPSLQSDFQFERVQDGQAEPGTIKLPTQFIHAEAAWLDPIYKLFLTSLKPIGASKLADRMLTGLEVAQMTPDEMNPKGRDLFRSNNDAYVRKIPADMLEEVQIYQPVEVILRFHNRITLHGIGDVQRLVTVWSTVDEGRRLALLRVYHISPGVWDRIRLRSGDNVAKFRVAEWNMWNMGTRSLSFYLTPLPRDEA